MSSKGCSSLNNRRPLKLVAVHLGAGNSRDDHKSMEFAKMICEEVMLQKRKWKAAPQSQDIFDGCPECQNRNHHSDDQITAESAVVQLIQRMEDNQDLNCALGSNLNMLGQVECDASLMSDKTQLWCAVGAVSGCRNPISLVKSLYEHQTMSRPLGLVQPNILVGSGAKQWMREHCPHLSVADSRLISSKSFSQYQRLKSRYDGVLRAARGEGFHHPVAHPDSVSDSINRQRCRRLNGSSGDECRPARLTASTSLDHGSYCMTENFHRVNESNSEHESNRNEPNITDSESDEDSGVRLNHDFETVNFDTVGAIAVDCDNNFVSAISSGGLLLKYKGRVGQAAVMGAGCWSKDNIAATTTGVGEYLTLNTFAKLFYDKMQTIRLLYDLGHVDRQIKTNQVINSCIEECFEDLMSSGALTHVPKSERLAGILAVSSLNSKNSPPRIDERNLYLSYGHNTSSMCIGYMTCNDVAGHSLMSRQEVNDNAGQPLVRTIQLHVD